MYSHQYILEKVRAALIAVSVPTYLDTAPPGTAYPFCTMNMVSSATDYDLGGGLRIEAHRLQITVYADTVTNTTAMMAMAGLIDDTMEAIHLGEVAGKNKILGAFRENTIGPRWIGSERIWQLSSDWLIRTQIDSSFDEESSSSSSDSGSLSDASSQSTDESYSSASSQSSQSSDSSESSASHLVPADISPLQAAPDQTRRALIVDIHDYEGTLNDLPVPAYYMATRWQNTLTSKFGFEVTRISNVNATVSATSAAILDATDDLSAGDAFVLVILGHGSPMGADVSGDEGDETDEGRYLYDGFLIDDAIYDLLAEVPTGVKITVVLESCFSGTGTRALRLEEDMREVLFSATSETSVAYDSSAYGPLFSKAFLDTLDNSTCSATAQEVYDGILAARSWPVNYYSQGEQMPGLEGSAANKASRIFW